MCITFAEAAERALASKRQQFTNAKHETQWSSTLRRYAYPGIGRLSVDAIERKHVSAILEPIWFKKTETARRVRQRIETVLNWATAYGYRQGDNPARWRGNLDLAFPGYGKYTRVKHHRALPWQELPTFIAQLRERAGIAARALEFTILTAARSGEVRGAVWSEIDLNQGIWTVPEQRMKAGKEHRVPLSGDAVQVLLKLPRLHATVLVFVAPRGGLLSDIALTAVLRRMQVNAVPHGFRSTFRDWCAEHTNYAKAVCEMALAHTIANKTEAAYRRCDMIEKRRDLMKDWAAFGSGLHHVGDVVPMRRARAY